MRVLPNRKMSVVGQRCQIRGCQVVMQIQLLLHKVMYNFCAIYNGCQHRTSMMWFHESVVAHHISLMGSHHSLWYCVILSHHRPAAVVGTWSKRLTTGWQWESSVGHAEPQVESRRGSQITQPLRKDSRARAVVSHEFTTSLCLIVPGLITQQMPAGGVVVHQGCAVSMPAHAARRRPSSRWEGIQCVRKWVRTTSELRPQRFTCGREWRRLAISLAALLQDARYGGYKGLSTCHTALATQRE